MAARNHQPVDEHPGADRVTVMLWGPSTVPAGSSALAIASKAAHRDNGHRGESKQAKQFCAHARDSTPAAALRISSRRCVSACRD